MGEDDIHTEQDKNYLAVFRHPPGTCDLADPETEEHFITTLARGRDEWDIRTAVFLDQLPPPRCFSCKTPYILDSVQLD